MCRNRRSHPGIFYKNVVLKKFRKIHRKILVSGSLFQRSFQPATILEKRPQHRCFPVKFVKVLRTYNLQNKKHSQTQKRRESRTRLLVTFSQYENLNRNDRLKRVGAYSFLEDKVKFRRLIFSFFELLRFCIFLSLTVAK